MIKLSVILAAALLALPGCTEELTPDEVDEVDELDHEHPTEPAEKKTVDTEPGGVDTVGTTTCGANKVLICHIPPGNPANAHNICVGQPAVEPHQNLHGDTIGGCSARPTVDPVCQPYGATCNVDGDCCSGACSQNECYDRI